jgi:hypothetical protein
MKPIHQHDCEQCTFVGNLFIGDKYRIEADLWKSCQTYGGTYRGLILRFSSEGSDYASFPAEHLDVYLWRPE